MLRLPCLARPRRLRPGRRLRQSLPPILVRPPPEGFPEHLEIVTGARQFRAAQLAGLDSVPVRVVSLPSVLLAHRYALLNPATMLTYNHP